jgi:hypothetical protein
MFGKQRIKREMEVQALVRKPHRAYAESSEAALSVKRPRFP